MLSSAKEIVSKIEESSKYSEFMKIIKKYNQELVKNKSELYSFDFQELVEKDLDEWIHVRQRKAERSPICNKVDSHYQSENIYRKKLLRELTKSNKKSFLG